MTNMAQAISQAQLRQTPPKPPDKPCERKTAKQMAKWIHRLAATSAGYTMKHGPEKWAKLWLPSPEFVLMEIDIAAAAAPHLPRNPERVAQRLLCSADEHEPVVVDLNRRKVGKTMLGYIPEVIYLDGKHRIKAQSMQGHTRTWAWVGTKAIPKLKRTRIITQVEAAAVLPKVDPTKMAKTYELYATTVPSTGMPVTRQDSGEGGSRPTTSVVRSGGPGSGRHKGSGGFATSKKKVYDSHVDREEIAKKMGLPSAVPGAAGIDRQGNIIPRQDRQGKLNAHGGGTGSGGSRPTTSVVRSGKKLKAGGPGSGRRPEAGSTWMHHSNHGRYELHEGIGKNGGEWRAKERWGKNREDLAFDSKRAAMDHIDNSQDGLNAAGGGATGGPGASNTGGSGFNPAREGFEAEGDCGCQMTANSTFGDTKGARSSGQLADPDASDTKVPQSASDAGPRVSPSDRREWLGDVPNDRPPGSRGWGDYGDPAKESPGSGSGPKVGIDPGDSKSVLRTDVRKAKSTMRKPEVARTKVVRAKGKKVAKIWNDEIDAVAPPGFSEKTMHSLKRKHGTASAFKIAWSQHKKMKAKGGR